MTAKQDLIAQIAEHFPASSVELLSAAVVASIGFEPIQGEGALGDTRIGGSPDLNPSVEWPVRPAGDPDGRVAAGGSAHALHIEKHLSQALPYPFIAQIDLAEAAALGDIASDLPSEGRLLFFYDYQTGPWGDGPASARVIWDRSACETLVRSELPTEFLGLAKEEEQEFRDALSAYPDLKGEPFQTTYWGPAKPQRLVVEWSLPNAFAYEVRQNETLSAELFPEDQSLEEDDALYDSYIDFEPTSESADDERFGYLSHKLLGLPDADWQQARAEGTIYFLIRNDDLRDRHFDRVFAVYQQT